jgi:RHS repeat-associated protein
VALAASGGATASQLYAPYGAVRYANGAMPTDFGFTGQRADAATGLSYYDPVTGQFTSADTAVPGGGLDLWGLSRYAYTRGDATSGTDPTGHDGPFTPPNWVGGPGALFDFGGGGGDFGSGF